MKSVQSMANFQSLRIVQLQDKARLLFINLVKFNPSPKAINEPTLDDIRPLADALNAHGWLHPPLIDQHAHMQDLQDLGTVDAGDDGAIQQWGDADEGKIGVIGWACNAHTMSPADAVVLSWERPGGAATPFAVAPVAFERPGEADDSPLRYSGWRVDFPIDMLPEGTLDVRAWTIDTSTAKAAPLGGMFRLTVPPRSGPNLP